MLFFNPGSKKKCIGKDLSPAYLFGGLTVACLAQPLLSFPVGISKLYFLLLIPTYSCKCKNFCPLKMQFQLGQRIKGQMDGMSFYPS